MKCKKKYIHSLSSAMVCYQDCFEILSMLVFKTVKCQSVCPSVITFHFHLWCRGLLIMGLKPAFVGCTLITPTVHAGKYVTHRLWWRCCVCFRVSLKMRMERNISIKNQNSLLSQRFPSVSSNFTQTNLAKKMSKWSRTPAGWARAHLYFISILWIGESSGNCV